MMRPPRAGGYTKRESRRIAAWEHGLWPNDNRPCLVVDAPFNSWRYAKWVAWQSLPDVRLSRKRKRDIWLAAKKSTKQLEKQAK